MNKIKYSIFEVMLMVIGVFPSTILIGSGIKYGDSIAIVIGVIMFFGQAFGIILQLYKHRDKMRTTRESISVVLGGALAGIGFALLPAWLAALMIINW